jgi:hypothetical protein
MKQQFVLTHKFPPNDIPAVLGGSVRRNSRLKKSNEMQQYADIYLLLNYSICFGRPSRPSSGEHKIVVAASATDHTTWGASFLIRGQIRTGLEPSLTIIHNNLRNQKVPYRVHSDPPSASVLNWVNPVYGLLSHLKDPFKYYPPLLLLGLPNGFFPSGFAIKTHYAFLFSRKVATCFTQLHHPCFDHSNNVLREVHAKITKLLGLLRSPPPCQLPPPPTSSNRYSDTKYCLCRPNLMHVLKAHSN